jgi:hypothetical protein
VKHACSTGKLRQNTVKIRFKNHSKTVQKPFKTTPSVAHSAYSNGMGANGLRGFTEGAAQVALHHPRMLLVSAGNDPGQPAPLSLDAPGVAIGRMLGCLNLTSDHDRATRTTTVHPAHRNRRHYLPATNRNRIRTTEPTRAGRQPLGIGCQSYRHPDARRPSQAAEGTVIMVVDVL